MRLKRKPRIRAREHGAKQDDCAPLNFFHPDYTVGFGIAPNRPVARFAGSTAGEELHLALKFCAVHTLRIPGAAVKQAQGGA